MTTPSQGATGAAVDERPISGLDRWFSISRRGSSVSREVRGGLVTFFTMAYILALNPLIIGTATDSQGNLVSGAPLYLDAAQTQMDLAARNESIAMVAAATALIAGVMTLLMGIIGRYPIGLATGLGLNAMVAYVIAPQMTWPQAMGLIVVEGLIITILVFTGFREAVFRAVPPALRTAISVGIGLFITFVGLVDSGVVRKAAGTPVELGIFGSLRGWPIAVFVIGFFLLLFLEARKIKGAMLISILTSTVLAVLVEAALHIGPHVGSDNPTGWALNVPSFPDSLLVAPNLGLLGRVDILGAFGPGGAVTLGTFLTATMLTFSLMLADFFDTVGTVVAVGAEGELLDETGEPEHLREILLVDSLGAVAGGLGSTSSNTSYIESTAGVAEGARTGLASVITGAGFLLAVFLSPLMDVVPSEAVAPVLVFVGFLMMSQVAHIHWNDIEEAVPAFITIVLMPFTYSITVGIGAGFISYVLLKLFRGKIREVHPLMWVVSALFVVYFVQGMLTDWVAGI